MENSSVLNFDFTQKEDFNSFGSIIDDSCNLILGDEDKSISMKLTPEQIKNLFSLLYNQYEILVEEKVIEPYEDIKID